MEDTSKLQDEAMMKMSRCMAPMAGSLLVNQPGNDRARWTACIE
jgi:hypothetical protein